MALDTIARGLASKTLSLFGTDPYDFYNISGNRASQLPKWRKAMSNLRRGAGPARIACVGDSTTRGSHALAGANDYSAGYPAQLARYIAPKYGLTATWDSFFGACGVSLATIAALDTRFTYTGALAEGAGAAQYSFGSATFEMTSASSMTFAPIGNVDTFKIYYIKSTTYANGIFTWSIDGGSTTQINSSGSNSVGIATVSAGALGAHAITLAWVSGTVEIIGFEGYNASNVNSTLTVLNGGIDGGASPNWVYAALPWSPGNAATYTALSADLIMINLGINEELNAISPATYTSNMQTLITSCLTVADVALIAHTPCSATTASQQAIIAAVYALAATNNIPVIDLFKRWGSNAAFAKLNGFGYYGDVNHPTAMGYGDVANAIGNVIFSI
jgi:lysophospholipase L1-like esterase